MVWGPSWEFNVSDLIIYLFLKGQVKLNELEYINWNEAHVLCPMYSNQQIGVTKSMIFGMPAMYIYSIDSCLIKLTWQEFTYSIYNIVLL